VKSNRCKKIVATIKPTKVTYVDLIFYYLFIYFVLYDALSTSRYSRTAGLHEITEWYFEFLCIKIRV
jgi:hypothetical protein